MHAAAARVSNGSESMSEAILGCHFHENKKTKEDWKPDVEVGTIDITMSVNISNVALTVKDAFLVRI